MFVFSSTGLVGRMIFGVISWFCLFGDFIFSLTSRPCGEYFFSRPH